MSTKHPGTLPEHDAADAADDALGALRGLSVRDIIALLAESEEDLHKLAPLDDVSGSTANSARWKVLQRQRALVLELQARRLALGRHTSTKRAASASWPPPPWV